MPMHPHHDDFNRVSKDVGTGVDAPVDAAGRTALHISAAKGDMLAIAKLIKRRAHFNQVDSQGQTPLYEAIATANLPVIRLLMENGATFYVTDSQKRTPLMWAIEKNCSVEFLKQLRDLGVPLDMQSDHGRTILHAAATHDRADIIRYLLEHGLFVDQADRDGKTPLHVSVEAKASAALRQLLDLGANPLQRTNKIETPLYLAALTGNEEAVDILLADSAVSTSVNGFKNYDSGSTPLLAAVRANHLPIVKKLIAVGADINQKDTLNRHSLLIAVENGFVDIVGLLISHGADMQDFHQSNQIRSPLIHRIGPKNYTEILRMLHGAGADLGALNSYGQTALHLAVSYAENINEKIGALLDFGVDPNVIDFAGQRALDIVAHQFYAADSLALARILLERGAKPSISPSLKMDEGPLHLAAKYGHKQVVELLLAHGAPIDERDRNRKMTALLVAIDYGRFDVANILLKAGADPLQKDESARTALHMAARQGSADFLEILLGIPALKTEVNARDSAGMTPLHHAFREGKAGAIQVLVKNGADPWLYDNAGMTAMHHAVNGRGGFSPTIFTSLIRSPADWSVSNRNTGETPLHLVARSYSSSPILDQLLQLGANVGAQDKAGMTPLHSAAKAKNTQTCRTLANWMRTRQIPLDLYRDTQGRTALHCAVAERGREVALLLLEGGADINARMANGDTSLHIAVRLGHVDMVDVLISREALREAQNNAGQTPLAIALTGKNDQIIKMLTPALPKAAPPAAPPRTLPRPIRRPPVL